MPLMTLMELAVVVSSINDFQLFCNENDFNILSQKLLHLAVSIGSIASLILSSRFHAQIMIKEMTVSMQLLKDKINDHYYCLLLQLLLPQENDAGLHEEIISQFEILNQQHIRLEFKQILCIEYAAVQKLLRQVMYFIVAARLW